MEPYPVPGPVRKFREEAVTVAVTVVTGEEDTKIR